MKGSDSPENWIQIRLFYQMYKNPAATIANMREVDTRTLRVGLELEKANLVETWHTRFGGAFLALRVRPCSGNHVTVREKLENLGSELKRKKHVVDDKFDMKNFLQSEECPGDLKSWDEWHVLMRILNLLSHIVIEIQSLKDKDRRCYMFYSKAVHHLDNMVHIQDAFNPYLIREGVYEEILGLLENQDAAVLAQIMDKLDPRMMKRRWSAKFHTGEVI